MRGSETMKEVVETLIKRKETISTMESCTGGAIANAITNIEGSSAVLKFSAVTYSNEYKIKMGVSKDTIDKYTVYSMEVAKEMAQAISTFTNSNYGIGITGRMNVEDPNNQGGNISFIYIAIYNKNNNDYYTLTLNAKPQSRENNKEMILQAIIGEFKYLLKVEK